MYKPTRKVAGVLASVGVGIGLIGGGAYATFTSGATATDKLATGSFGCQVSSTDPNAVSSPDGNSVTITNPPILSSVSGNYLTSVSVKNTGSMPQVVHWTIAPGPNNTMALQPAGRMGYASGTVADPMSTDISLAAGASHTYTNGIGFMWAELTNADLTQTAEVVYSATCSEVPPPTASNISFVGAVDGNLTPPVAKHDALNITGMYPHVDAFTAGSPGSLTSLASPGSGGTLPSGWPASGSFTVPTSGGTATLSYSSISGLVFNGLVDTSGTVGYISPGAVVTQVVTSPSLALPAGAAVGDMAISYAEDGSGTLAPSGWTVPTTFGTNYNQGYYFGIAYHVLTVSDIAAGRVTFLGGTHSMVAVYHGVAGIGNVYTTNWGNNQNWGCGTAYSGSSAPLQQRNGSSWAVCVGGDGRDASPAGFSDAANWAPSVWGTTLRSGGFSDIKVGLSDSNGGVATWAPPVYASGDYNYGANFGIELLSK